MCMREAVRAFVSICLCTWVSAVLNCVCYVICYVMLYYIMLCYISFCYVMLRYVTICYVTICYVMLHYVTLCYVMLRYVMLHYARLLYFMLCYVMLRYVTICYVMLCYVTLRYVTLGYFTLCYAMLRYVTLCYIICYILSLLTLQGTVTDPALTPITPLHFGATAVVSCYLVWSGKKSNVEIAPAQMPQVRIYLGSVPVPMANTILSSPEVDANGFTTYGVSESQFLGFCSLFL